MTHLRGTYGLVLADLAAAQIRAYGVNGWSAWSSANTAGANVETEPAQMNTPTEGTLTSES
jgi:hypothetical protein